MAEETLTQLPRQLTDTIVMSPPQNFAMISDAKAAESNSYITPATVFMEQTGMTRENIRDAAMAEFNMMVNKLRANSLDVLILPARTDIVTGSVFPNNWFSYHQEGTIVLYPMLVPQRREERQLDALKGVLTQVDIVEPTVLDLSEVENEGKALEGTGSIVLDRQNKVAFGMQSPRTTKEMFDAWCGKMGYEGVFFHAFDIQKEGKPVYHTNVVMSIGEDVAVVCLESITDDREREMVETRLQQLGKEVIKITVEQMGKFCGNVLQVRSKKGEPKIILSTQAYSAFTKAQQDQLAKHGDLVAVYIPVIETVGGGSARCMLAEVFPPEK